MTYLYSSEEEDRQISIPGINDRGFLATISVRESQNFCNVIQVNIVTSYGITIAPIAYFGQE